MGDADVRQFEQRLPAVPAGQGGEGVGTEQQDQRPQLAALIGLAQAFEGEHGVAGLGGVDFGGIDFEAGILGGGQADHRQTVLRGHLRRCAQRRLTGRNPAHAGQLELVGGFFGEPQVTEMNRIEGAAKNSQRLVA
jgi:hypothetical protein